MVRISTLAVALALALPAGPALALETSLQFVLDLPPSAERHVASYRCDGRDEPLIVEYLNAAPNFLAIVPVDGENLVFASVLAGSGVRYSANQYEWRTKGPEAGLYDLMSDDPNSPPILFCLEVNDIP